MEVAWSTSGPTIVSHGGVLLSAGIGQPKALHPCKYPCLHQICCGRSAQLVIWLSPIHSRSVPCHRSHPPIHPANGGLSRTGIRPVEKWKLARPVIDHAFKTSRKFGDTHRSSLSITSVEKEFDEDRVSKFKPEWVTLPDLRGLSREGTRKLQIWYGCTKEGG